MIDVASQLEAFLFSEGGPIAKKRLAQLSGLNTTELEAGLNQLNERFAGHGLSLVRTETEVALAMTSEAGEAVVKAHGKDLERDIGDAGLEVLAIVLYRGPSTRAQIDFIRGVNTASTVRNLLSRGLLERAGNPVDGREYLYRPTVELMTYLGAHETRELPEYATIASELANFEKEHSTLDAHGDTADTIHDASSQ